MSMLQKLWVEKYRPQTIDEYVFQSPEHELAIKAMIANKSIPHLLLAGVRGTGKTTLSRILLESIGVDPMDIHQINASDKRGIDTFRDEVKSFVETVPVGTFKVLYLEEAEQLTPDAQKALKSFMEDNSDYFRCIFTTNHINKVIVELRSRFQEFIFKASPIDDVVEYAVTVLAAEKVKFTLDIVDKYVAASYPDVRKIINNLQLNSAGGVLRLPVSETQSADYKTELLGLLAEKKWAEARELVCATIPAEGWEELYRFLYENIAQVPPFAKSKEKWEEAIVLIADHLYKNTLVADPEINGAALFIRLSMIK